MKRRKFFKRLAVGSAALVVAPKLFGEESPVDYQQLVDQVTVGEFGDADNDTHRLTFFDNTGTERTFPLVYEYEVECFHNLFITFLDFSCTYEGVLIAGIYRKGENLNTFSTTWRDTRRVNLRFRAQVEDRRFFANTDVLREGDIIVVRHPKLDGSAKLIVTGRPRPGSYHRKYNIQ